MMTKLTAWIKENKLSSILLALVIFLLVSNVSTPTTSFNRGMSDKALPTGSFLTPDITMERAAIPPIGGSAPQLDITDRKVVTESNFSLVVSDVRKAINDIKIEAQGLGGYMVNSAQTAPEGLATGSISIRVPSDQLDAALEYMRDMAVKVVSERITGTDIADEYVDIEARLETLYGTKTRYEAILNKAEDVEDIMRVTQQILYVQDQIDHLMGQLEYLDATSSSSLITIYLSTDEFELPYSPEQPWRPKVVFKYAVRSLVQTLREVGSLAIWLGVYAIIWLPVLIIALIIRKKKQQKPS